MRKIFALIFMLLFIACMVLKPYKITEDYEGKRITGKTLAIAPLFPKPYIENRIDIIQELGDGNPEMVYKLYFEQNLLRYLKRNSFFSDIYHAKVDPTTTLHDRKLALSEKRKLFFKIPIDGQSIHTDSIKADFVLFIQNLLVSRGNVRAVPHFGGGATPIPATPLQHGKFLFWDNVRGSIVSFGEFDEDNNLTPNAVHNIVREILYESPFENRRKNRISKRPR